MLDLANLEPSESLLEGRRYLEWLSEDCTVKKDYSYQKNGKWLLILSLKNKGKASKYIPDYSDWYVFVGSDYPNAKIDFYPSKVNGIEVVFPHQTPHFKVLETEEYYYSNICLEQFSPSLDSELLAETDKLYNYTKKALEWIKSAADGELLAEGDFFEKVAYPIVNYKKRIIFCEDNLSFKTWDTQRDNKVGFFNMKLGKPGTSHEDYYYVTDYYKGISGYKQKKAQIVSYSWGKHVMNEISSDEKGIWIMLLDMPYILPWQAPENWPQLISILKKNNIDFSKEVMPFLNNLRDRRSHVFMLGFPISEKINGQISEIHWQALELPILSDFKTSDRYFKGFRKEEEGFEIADMRRIFYQKKISLDWLSTENWSPDNLVSRGNLSKSIKKKSFLFIGVGALGSMISESFVRSGITEVDLVDPDFLEMGNITRHSLAVTDVGKYKASAMEKLLTRLFIHYKGTGFNMSAEELFEKKEEIDVNKYDIIVETTGNDKIIGMLSEKNLNSTIISISLGLYAKRMYINIQKGSRLKLNEFKENIQEWLEKDRIEFSHLEYPRDGFGCWHPLFPARLDHLSLLASSAISIIESDILTQKESLTIIERGELGTVSIVKRKEFVNEN